MSHGAALHVVRPAPTLASLGPKPWTSLSHKPKPQWKILFPAQAYGKVSELCHLPSQHGPKACHTMWLMFWVDASCHIHISHEWRMLQLPGEQCIWNRPLSLLYLPVSYPECYLATSEQHCNSGSVTHSFSAFKNQPVWVLSICCSVPPPQKNFRLAGVSEWPPAVSESLFHVQTLHSFRFYVYEIPMTQASRVMKVERASRVPLWWLCWFLRDSLFKQQKKILPLQHHSCAANQSMLMYLPVYSHMLHVTDADPGGRGGAGPAAPPPVSQTNVASEPCRPSRCRQETCHTHTCMHCCVWLEPPPPWLPLSVAAAAVFLPDLSCCLICHLHSAPMWATRVLAASVWCWELGFPAE